MFFDLFLKFQLFSLIWRQHRINLEYLLLRARFRVHGTTTNRNCLLLKQIFMSSSRMNSHIMLHRKAFPTARIITKVSNFTMSFHVTFQIIFGRTFGTTDLAMQIRDDFLVMILVILPFTIIVKVLAAKSAVATFVVSVKKIKLVLLVAEKERIHSLISSIGHESLISL